jgi:hypothetical protein
MEKEFEKLIDRIQEAEKLAQPGTYDYDFYVKAALMREWPHIKAYAEVRRIAADKAKTELVYKLQDKIEQLYSLVREALHSLCDPQDACDHGNSAELALRATINEAIEKLKLGLNTK